MKYAFYLILDSVTESAEIFNLLYSSLRTVHKDSCLLDAINIDISWIKKIINQGYVFIEF